MAELDRSRDLTFVHGSMIAADGTPGLGIQIPITRVTRQWSAAFKQLAFDQHVDVHATHDHLSLRLVPGISREDLLQTLNLTMQLVDQANQSERDKLDATSAVLEPLEETAGDWWQQR